MEALRGELAAVREESDRKVEDLGSRLQEQLASSQRVEQQQAAASRSQINEVSAGGNPRLLRAGEPMLIAGCI